MIWHCCDCRRDLSGEDVADRHVGMNHIVLGWPT